MTESRASEVSGGVTAPRGFKASGVACGIKASGLPDLAVIASDGPASAAAVFTTNLAQAAPVIVSREHLAASRGRARGVVVNSGCANACTGTQGMADAESMAGEAAAALIPDTRTVAPRRPTVERLQLRVVDAAASKEAVPA